MAISIPWSMILALRGSLDASTRRSPARGAGGQQKGTPTTVLTGLKVLPLDPVDEKLRDNLQLKSTYKYLRTTVIGEGLDIQIGDILVVGSSEYPIGGLKSWVIKNQIKFDLYLENGQA